METTPSLPYRVNELKACDLTTLYNEHGSAIAKDRYERPEQLVAYNFVLPDMKVLEVGARFGVVSCVINKMLDHPSAHVAVEPDATVLKALTENRRRARAKFQIFEGVIGNDTTATPTLIPCNDATRVDYSGKTVGPGVSTVTTYAQLKEKFGLQFDCLIADCEGGLQTVFDCIDDIASYRMVSFERDFPKLCDYDAIHDKLIKAGFVLVLRGNLHSTYYNASKLPFSFLANPDVFLAGLGLFGKRGTTYEYPHQTWNHETTDVSLPLPLAIRFALNANAQIVCAHAPSTLLIRVGITPLTVHGFFNADVPHVRIHQAATYTWCIDRADVAEDGSSLYQDAGASSSSALLSDVQGMSIDEAPLNSDMFLQSQKQQLRGYELTPKDGTTESMFLAPGKCYKLCIAAESPMKFAHAHTGWFIEPVGSEI